MSHSEKEKLWEKYYRGETSAKEEALLADLLKNDTDTNHLPELQLFSMFDKSRQMSLPADFDDILIKEIDRRSSSADTRKSYWKWAATLLLLCLAAYAVITFPRASTIEVVAHESAQQFLLPDGSSVWLNKNSRMTYAKDFAQDRKVEFEGEGFFEIAHDATHPFEILSENSVTQVLGTSFNLRTYQEEDSVELIVVTGQVSFQPRDEKKIIVPINHRVVYNKANRATAKSKASDLNAIAWKTEVLTFSDAPLSKVIADLQRYKEVKFTIGNKETLNCHFTGAFKNETLEEILATLTFSLDINFKKSDTRHYEITGGSCIAK